jgi:hypothetical protein
MEHRFEYFETPELLFDNLFVDTNDQSNTNGLMQHFPNSFDNFIMDTNDQSNVDGFVQHFPNSSQTQMMIDPSLLTLPGPPTLAFQPLPASQLVPSP